jgi:trehalose-6-phosphatase
MSQDLLHSHLAARPLILVDIDGTCSEFVTNPEDAQIVDAFLQAARHYVADDVNGLVFVTGRDKASADRMIYGANGSRDLPFRTLTSHGGVFTERDGELQMLPYTDTEAAFIDRFITETVAYVSTHYSNAAIDFKPGANMGKVTEPGLLNFGEGPASNVTGPLIEVKRDGLLVYTKFIEDADLRAAAHADIAGFLETLMASDANPEMDNRYAGLQDDTGSTRSFALKHETADQMEVRGPFSKGAALFAHGILSEDMDRPVVCFVDTLGPDGTDRTMAKAVKQLGGIVVQVQNPGREQSYPQAGDPVFPDVVFGSPTALANAFHGSVVTAAPQAVQSTVGGRDPALSL